MRSNEQREAVRFTLMLATSLSCARCATPRAVAHLGLVICYHDEAANVPYRPAHQVHSRINRVHVWRMGWMAGNNLKLIKGYRRDTLAVVASRDTTRIWRDLLPVHDNRRGPLSRGLQKSR